MEVYGIVAPLRSIPESLSISLSYKAILSAGIKGDALPDIESAFMADHEINYKGKNKKYKQKQADNPHATPQSLEPLIFSNCDIPFRLAMASFSDFTIHYAKVIF